MELYIGNMWWNPTGRTIAKTMSEVKAQGLNMVRLPIAPQTLSATDPQGINSPNHQMKNAGTSADPIQKNALDGLTHFLDVAKANSVKVLIDIHSCSNYVGWRAGVLDAAPPYVDANRVNYDFTREDKTCKGGKDDYNETKWLANLKTIATLAKNYDNIIGIDLFNEPWGYTWDQWATLSEHAYDAINSVNKDVLIFVEGVSGGSIDKDYKAPHGDLDSNPNWGENFYGLQSRPLTIPKDRLVLSPHTYGPSVYVQKQFLDPNQSECVSTEDNLIDGDKAADAKCKIVINDTRLGKGWDEHFGYLRDAGYAMVVGEFGGNMDWPKKASDHELEIWGHITTPVDQQWQTSFVNYMVKKKINACYWAINPESGDTAGWYLMDKYFTDPSFYGTWDGLDSRKTTILKKLWGG